MLPNDSGIVLLVRLKHLISLVYRHDEKTLRQELDSTIQLRLFSDVDGPHDCELFSFSFGYSDHIDNELEALLCGEVVAGKILLIVVHFNIAYRR